MEVKQNLKSAFINEAQASIKYQLYSQIADKQGYPRIAKLFSALADAEKIHALNHLKILESDSKTIENAQKSFETENYEYHTLYPKYIEEATSEGTSEDAVESFNLAKEAEKVHSLLFANTLSDLKQSDVSYHVCQNCGNVSEHAPQQTCSVCGETNTFRQV